MRLVATCADQEKAIAFSRLLLSRNIPNQLEAKLSKMGEGPSFTVWIEDEDHFEEAQSLYEAFEKEPHIAPKTAPIEGVPIQIASALPQRDAAITRFVILLCVFVFLWNSYQQGQLKQKMPGYAETLGITKLESQLLYDLPQSFFQISSFFQEHPEAKSEEVQALPLTPSWQGIYPYFKEGKGSLSAPRFTKIKEGQVWRFITPVFLHGGFLHILFNMLWLVLLGTQVEARLPKSRYLLLMLIIGVMSNTAQYLMTGPYFMGYSGIVCGLVAFIWMRQRLAPWEGYPLQRSTILFLAVFVLGLLGLDLLTFAAHKLTLPLIHIPVANTAHLIGASTGLLLAKNPFFGGR